MTAGLAMTAYGLNEHLHFEKVSIRLYFDSRQSNDKGAVMLRLVLLFLCISIIAGVLGFTGISEAAAGIAKIIFVIFLILFVITLIVFLFAAK